MINYLKIKIKDRYYFINYSRRKIILVFCKNMLASEKLIKTLVH